MKRVVLASLVTMASAGALVVAQQTSTVPQPRAEALPAPGTGSPKVSRTVPKPEAVMPTVPAGFTVTTYAELPTPRMMVYAPNGDLFVSSPGANTIVVLRDTNNDGRFEACSVYAAGDPPGAGRGGRGVPAPPPAVPPGCSGALTNPNAPPAPAAPAAAPQAAAPAPAAGAPGGQRAAGPPPQPPGGGRGAPPVLGANAPACMPPPDFVQKGPGELRAPFGLAFHDGYLYVGNTASLVRYKYSNGDLKAQGEPEKLMNLPAGGHTTRNVLFNRAGTKMYIAVGSQLEQRRRRRLPARRDPRVQSGWQRLPRLRVRHSQPGRPGASAGHRHHLDGDERARQPTATTWCPTTRRQ